MILLENVAQFMDNIYPLPLVHLTQMFKKILSIEIYIQLFNYRFDTQLEIEIWYT